MKRFAYFLLALFLVSCGQTATSGIVVTKVVDGDTMHVRLEDGKDETIRVLGIDTPETVDPRRPTGCFGKQASDRMKALAQGKTVTLEVNPAEERDKYGRLLRYVHIDGVDVGASLVKDGYAFSYKRFPHPRLELYNALEQEARESNRGLWGDVCDYASE